MANGLQILSSPIKKRKGASDLPSQVQELESLRSLTGAPQIEEDKPGFLTRTIDALSAFNYATAGATEELAKGRGLGAAVGRAATELYSSARSLPFGQLLPEMDGAQKKAFGEVFEGLGIGTRTLGDFVPMLEGTFIGELVNTRGTVGLALDIFADPTTYLTFGASAVARRTASRFAELGIKQGVNKKGLKWLNEAESLLRKAEPGLTDDVYRARAAKQLVESGQDDLFDPGGVKWAGIAIGGMPGMPTARIAEMGKPLVDSLNSFGLGRGAVRAAESFGRATSGIAETLGNLGDELFDPFYRIKGLGSAQKTEAERVMRKYPNNVSLLRSKYVSRIQGGSISDLEKLPEADLRRMVDGLEDGTFVPRNATEEAAATELRSILDEIGEEGVAAGVFDQAQIDKNPMYMIHAYLNDTLDQIPEMHLAETGRGADMVPGSKHAKSRVFDTMKQAQEWTRRMERMGRYARSKGIAQPIWKELQPNYNIKETLISYVDWFAKQKSMRLMTEELGERFGWDVTKTGELAMKFLGGSSDYIADTHREWERVYSFFEDTKRMSGLLKQADQAGGRAGAMAEVMADARKHLGSIKDEYAQRQFMHELLLRTNTLEQMDEVMQAFGDKLHLMPRAMSEMLEGTVEEGLKRFGDSAVYVRRGGNSIWGKKEKMLPKLLVDAVESADATILSGRGTEGFERAFEGWHVLNNWFKTSVYPFFPSSQVRNSISNVYLNGLRLGWHALNPQAHKHSLMILAGKEGQVVSKTGRVYSYSELRRLFDENGIKARVEVLLERTGRSAKNIKRQTKAGKYARQAIAFNENESRFMLAVQDILDGLSVEEAAEDVAEFLFNYGEIAPVHRFIQSFVPFTTFTVKNIKAQVKALKSQPGRVANQLKPFRGRSDENEQMVKWEAEGLKLRINKDGKSVIALTNIDLPMRNMDTIWAGGFGATGRRLLGMMSPLIKTPIEVTTQTDFFTGKHLDRRNAPSVGRLAEHLPRYMQDWIGYKKVTDEAGRPRYTVDAVRYKALVESFVFSRIMSTSDRQFRDYAGDEGIASIMLDTLTGLRFKDVNFNEQQERLLRRRRKQLIESLGRRGVLDPFEVPGKPDLEGLP